MFGSGSQGYGFGVTYTLEDEFTRTSQRIQQSFGQLEGRTQQSARKMDNALSGISAGFSALLGAAAIAAPLALAVQASSQFNAQIDAVGAKARATAEEMVMLKTSSLDLGDSTRYSAQQVAEGQEFLAMAGFSVNNIVGAMPGMLNLAASANMDLARAADITSNVMSAFGLSAQESNRVADVFAMTASRANVSVEQMGQSFKFLAPIASSLNIPLEESAAVIGMLGDTGLQGTIATTSLSTALTRLTKPTKEMTGVMNRLNIEAFRGGQFVGFTNLLGQVEEKTKNLTEEQRLNTVSTLFGAEASKNFLSIMGLQKEVMVDGERVTLQGAEALKAFTGELQNSGGAAQEMAERMMDNLAGDITKFTSVLQTTMITVGDMLEPMLRPLVQVLTDMLGMFKSFVATPIGKAFLGITIAGMGLIGVLIGINAVMGLMVPSMITMAKASLAAMAPLLPWIAAGIALGAMFYAIYKGVQLFNESLDSGRIHDGFTGFLQRLGGVIMGVWQIWKSWNGETFELTEKMASHLENLGILDLVVNIGTWAVRVQEFFKGVSAGFSEVWKLVQTTVSAIVNAVRPWLQQLGVLRLDIDSTASSVKQWAEAGRVFAQVVSGVLVAILVVLIIKFAALAVSVVAATWPILAIGAALYGVYELFKNWGDITDWIGEKVLQMTSYVSNKFNDLIDWIAALPYKMAEYGSSMVSGLKEGFSSMWSTFTGWLSQQWSTLTGNIPYLDQIMGMFSEDGGQLSIAGAGGTGNLTQSINGITAQQRGNGGSTRETVNNNNTEKVRNINLSLQVGDDEIKRSIRVDEYNDDYRN